jgi:hypothetical protein
MNSTNEKKHEKPVSVRLKPSTIEALHKVCHNEDRPMGYVIEKAVREKLGLDKE